MTTWQARKIRTGIRMANRCWDLTKFGGLDNDYYHKAVEDTRISMGRLSRRAFNRHLRKLEAIGKVAQR